MNFLTVLTTINTNLDLNSLFGGVVDIIIQIAMYVGIALAVGGVFSLVLAYKDENAEGQSRAVRIIVVGGALIGLRVLLQTAGLIN
jgi:hypothetical protein